MVVIRGLVAALLLAAVVAAGVVIAHGSPVKDAGQTLGYQPPAAAHSLAVIGDSYSSGTAMGGTGTANWAVQLATASGVQYDGSAAVQGTGYLAKPSGGKTFAQQIPGVLKQQPDWLIVWGAFDDLASAAPLDKIEAAFNSTVHRLMSAVHNKHLPTHVVIVGPVYDPGAKDSLAAGPDVKYPTVKALATYEQALVTKLGGLRPDGTTDPDATAQYKGRLNYVDALNWFNGEQGVNSAYIGIDREHPIDLGHAEIFYNMQVAMAKFGFGANAPKATSPVPPYIHSTATTIPPVTKVVPTTLHVTATHTQNVTKTVQPPPTVITVTVAPTP